MLEYAETASLEYWKKRILSLNHKDLTDDNVIIGFNLSPEQRTIMKSKNIIVKLDWEPNEYDMGHEQVIKTATQSQYIKAIRRGISILIQSYKKSILVEVSGKQVEMSISNYLRAIGDGIKTKILFSGNAVKCSSDMTAIETRTSGDAGMIMYQRKMTFVYSAVLKLKISENNAVEEVLCETMI